VASPRFVPSAPSTLFALAALPLVAVLSSCSGSSDSPGSAVPTATSDPACATPLALTGDPIPLTMKGGAAPLPTGGTLVPGTYVLSLSNQYKDAVGDYAFRGAFTFDGQNFKSTFEIDGSVSGTTTRAGTYTTSGKSIVLTLTCETTTHPESASTLVSAFSTDGSVLVLSGTATRGTDNVENTFLKQ
jgi:hypothetical protein